MEHILRTLLGINLALGATVGLLLYAATPLLVTHLPHLSVALRASYQKSLAMGCALLIVKPLESVFICTQRAYERYGAAGRLSIPIRVVTIIVAVVIAKYGGGVVAIMQATLFIALVGLVLQGHGVWRDVRPTSLMPQWHRETARELFGFGCFSWLQAVVGLLTQHADRLIVAYMLGTQMLTYYSICIQAAQPIHGIAASGLHIIFPHLGARLFVAKTGEVRRKIAIAFAVNIVLVVALAVPMMLCGHYLLSIWMGSDFAAHASTVLTITTLSFAMLGLNVTGHYILLALGRIRTLAFINIAGAAAMLTAIALLTPKFGITGAAAGRLLYGPITWIIYYSIVRALKTPGRPGLEFGMLPEAYENG